MKIFDFLNFKLNEDLEFKMIETDFKEIIIPSLFIPNKNDTIYQFVSNFGNFYDLYFSLTIEDDYKLSNGKNISEYTDGFINTIFFSLTDRGLDPTSFDKLTNKGEKFEVMGKVIWLINQFDTKNQNNIYSVGEVDSKKYQFYSYYLHNIPQFTIVEGKSQNYGGKKCYYLLNENR